MKLKEQVKELMLPLSEYALVDQEATVVEALRSLEQSQKKLPAGKYLHRAVLVRDKQGRIVGKLGHYAVLRALLLKEDRLFADPRLHRAGVSDDMLEISRSRLNVLQENLNLYCERVSNAKVRDIMDTFTLQIDENAPILEAIKMFVDKQTLSLLVTRNREIVGILRISDLFDEIAGFMKCGDESKN